MRVIYPFEEERLRKGKPAAWTTRWWIKPFDWIVLLGTVMALTGFSVMPMVLLGDNKTTSNTIAFSLMGVQVCVSIGCVWLFMRAGKHARAYAEHGVVIARNVAARIGLLWGHGLLLMAFVIDALTK